MSAFWMQWESYHDREPPLEWLLSKHAEVYGLMYKFIGCGFTLLALDNCMQGSVLSAIASSCVPMALCLDWRLAAVVSSPRAIELIIIAGYLAIACAAAWLSGMICDPVHRHCAMTMASISFRALLPYSGLRFVPAAIIMLILSVNDMIGAQVIFEYHGEIVPKRLSWFIVSASCVFLAAVRQQQRGWRKLYEIEQQLADEKVASESVLSEVNDLIFWVGADGKRVLRSDNKLDALLGKRMQGEVLTDHVQLIDADGYRKVFSLAPGATSKPVQILPTTLICDYGAASLQVELQVQARRYAPTDSLGIDGLGAFSDEGALCFLVGLRQTASKLPNGIHTCKNFGNTPYAVGQFRQLQELRQLVPACPSSVKESPSKQGIRFETYSSGSATSALKRGEGRTWPRGILKKGYVPAHDLGAPVGPPAKPSGEYAMDCSEALLEDLVSTWNFTGYGCCGWHAATQRLTKLVARLDRKHTCADQWSPTDITWQCENCTGLMKEDNLTCWLCDVGVVADGCRIGITHPSQTAVGSSADG